uniref:ATP synthase subunit a n=1 Tax=Achelia bituberculata TaxID=262805 RepID=A7E1P8_ACHBT|nr:ATP synthase subunit 6 [Achelia bituberculata]
MMNNLFSVFDPTSNLLNIQLNWISMAIIIMFLYYNYWLMNSRFLKIINIMMITFIKEMGDNIKSKVILILFFMMIMFIFINNFMGLFPYIFTSTSHILITLSLALLLWISYYIYGWIMKTFMMLAHLVPIGTPLLLMPFMVLIETISNIIRPITLSVRLMANMTAGHLLISLMSGTCQNLNMFSSVVVVLLQMMLMILELAVAIIQSYVFTTLVLLYYNEMN